MRKNTDQVIDAKMGNTDIIKEHYKKEAEQYGFSSLSTTGDSVVRKKEIKLISNFLSIFTKKKLKVLDIGCGNGYVLSVLSYRWPGHNYFGLDLSEDLLSIARERKLKTCSFLQGDARFLPFDDSFFDIVYSERCLINILDWKEQQKALSEIHRILKPNGYYLMIECFKDGLINNNRLRKKAGLAELKERYHNKYFDKDIFFNFIKDKFILVNPVRDFLKPLVIEKTEPKGGFAFVQKLIKSLFRISNGVNPSRLFKRKELFSSNFLSTHYFIARVLHPLIGGKRKNTKLVKFFSFLPAIGNYSQIQAYIFKKI